MRSFFNRPSWATRGGEDQNKDQDIFRRANQTYADIIAANKEKRERHADNHVDPPEEGCNAHKRRYISHENHQRRAQITDRLSTVRRASAQLSELSACDTQPGEDNTLIAGGVTSPGKPSKSDTLGATNQRLDTFFDDIVGVNLPRITSSPERGHASYQLDDGRNAFPLITDNMERHNTTNAETPSVVRQDAIVQILITSKIDNTKPLIVNRKMSQSLRDVRLAWCDRQNLAKESQSVIYLTWKGKRLFDVTTCRSLGIGTEDHRKGSLRIDDCLPHEGGKLRVHMEAVTDCPLPSSDKRRLFDDPTGARQSLGLDGEKSQPDKVTLKCPLYAELHVNISRDTKISELIDTFRRARNISKDRDLCLAFDGDRLDPDVCIADYDMTDGDLVDVVIK